jgi:hypothetical protein
MGMLGGSGASFGSGRSAGLSQILGNPPAGCFVQAQSACKWFYLLS